MLQALHVHNFALIEDAKVEFTGGFNVFTGETGAGKSILIDAFSIALGARASADYVRSGTDALTVQAVFDIDDCPAARKLLEEQSIDYEDGLFLRRRITAAGKSTATVNGVQVPVAVLRSFAAVLVDVHGQHENQALLKADFPQQLTDLYGHTEIAPVLENYRSAFVEYNHIKDELERLQNIGQDRERILDRLEWEIEEITNANLQAGELDELQDEWKRLQNNGKIMQSVSAANELVDGKYSALDALAEARSKIESAARYDGSLNANAELLESCWLTLEECHKNLLDYLENNEFDAERAAYVEQRLDLWYRLQKKYGADYDAINAYLQKVQQEADELKEIDRSIAQKNKELAQKTEALTKLAAQLTELRKHSAQLLTKEITAHIADLAMPQGRIEISFTQKDDFGKNGCDEMTFLFSANAGEPLMELSKVASGGELSRIALAVKTVLFNELGVPTMIFDEIDTGIGGVTAQKMAEKIAVISRNGQVICITHLPQIASFADRHIKINKVSAGGRTQTELNVLDEAGRVDELMRMTAGENTSDAARQNAEELLENAAKFKNAG